MESVITVLIRTYNSEKTIKRALESVVQQSLDSKFYAILVVDDGSKDNTLEILQTFSEITLSKSKHKGSISALNSGLKIVQTPYVIILDSDDWFEKTILESMYDIFNENQEIDFVYSDYYEVTNGIRKIVSIKNNIFNTIAAGIMFRLELLKARGFYDASMIFAEYDLLIKIMQTANYHYIPEALYNYYRHSKSISADKSWYEQGKKELFEKYGKSFPIREY